MKKELSPYCKPRCQRSRIPHRHSAFAWENKPNIGDEIGVRSMDGKLLGHSKYYGENTGIVIAGDDYHTIEKEAIKVGELFNIYLWKANLNDELKLVVEEWIEGDDVYMDNKISVAGKLKEIPFAGFEKEDFIDCHPNPAGEITEIRFGISSPALIELKVINVDGKVVEVIDRNYYSTGIHYVKYDTGKLSSGIYLVYLGGDKISISTKLMIYK